MHVEQRSHCVCVSDLPASDLYLPVGHATHTSALLAVHGAAVYSPALQPGQTVHAVPVKSICS